MSADAPDLAPRPTPGFFARLNGVVLRAALPRFFAFARVVRPIWRAGDVYVATRSDDVRQILLEPHLFATPYRQNLDIVVGDEPFFLAIDDPLAHDAATGALRKAVRPGDVATRLAPAIERAAADAVTAGKGRIEVVDALARRPVFEVFTAYLGVGAPAAGDGDLSTSAGLLFEFQFADDGSPWLHAQARARAPRLRVRIQQAIDARRAAGDGPDDVLGRLLATQRQDGAPTDAAICAALVGLIVGGLPQPAIALAQALDQLLRRPQALRSAQAAARAGDDALLSAHILEALRFDPLAPLLTRVATQDCVLAPGTRRATKIPKGAMVRAASSSAMMDGRRLGGPRRFDARRLAHERLHFGLGLHECFAARMNEALLPLLVKPLLARENLRRAPGRAGRLERVGPFAHALHVDYD